MGFDTAGDRKITEPAKPAPKVAMPPMKERRSSKACLDSRFGSFFKAVPASPLRLSKGAILDPPEQAKVSRFTCSRFLLLK